MLSDKIQKIRDAIAQKESAIIAFSGGVDSTTLATLAFEELGERALAITADSATLPQRELEAAKRAAMEIGIPHRVVYFDEVAEPGFAINTPDRCYYCKKGLLRTLLNVAESEGYNVVIEGTNSSELKGHRPGRKAILEAGERVFTPYVDFEVTKDEVRQIARELGLSVADKPSMACLSSRFPYGNPITKEGLRRVGEAEDCLFSLGFAQFRVRDHNNIARIEVMPSDFGMVLQHRETILSHMKELGFNYVTLDLEGFRSGSMDEVLGDMG